MKKKAKRVFLKPASAPNGDINVTPLVDVVLVLLIIFMVVTPLLEKDINVSLPSTEKVEEVTEIPPDQLVVKINAAGEFAINADPVSPEEYVDRLKAKLERRAPADKIVFILADDSARYDRLVLVLDGAKLAGATVLGMATADPEPNAAAAPAAPPPTP